MNEFMEVKMCCESFLRKCDHPSLKREAVQDIYRLQRAIDRYVKEHPPDLGIHVEDGIKAEIKRGE